MIVQQELLAFSLFLLYNVGQVCKLRLLMVSMVCSICMLVFSLSGLEHRNLVSSLDALGNWNVCLFFFFFG